MCYRFACSCAEAWLGSVASVDLCVGDVGIGRGRFGRFGVSSGLGTGVDISGVIVSLRRLVLFRTPRDGDLRG